MKWNLALEAKKINKNSTFLDNRVKNVPTLSDECLSDTADEKLRTYLRCVALQGHTELKTKTYGQFSSVDAIKMRVETLFFWSSSDSFHHWWCWTIFPFSVTNCHLYFYIRPAAKMVTCCFCWIREVLQMWTQGFPRDNQQFFML